MTAEPTFTLGIEEEYLLVDPISRNLIEDAPPGLLADCQAALGSRVSPEFLQCQIEAGTGVCNSFAQPRADLGELRHTVSEIAARYDVALMAASTHPFAVPGEQKRTDKNATPPLSTTYKKW
jgi:glutamate---cysteine ligase / carboxylate-amine ligase